MSGIAERILKMDRRIIFLMVAVCIAFPIFTPLNIPGVMVTPPVSKVYDFIEQLPERSPIMISFDFDPASGPELKPMATAILRHAFRKNLRVIVTGLWVTGIGLADERTRKVAEEEKKEYGVDYVYLGWQPQPLNVIMGVSQSFTSIFPKDHSKNDVRSLKVMEGVNSLRDLKYVFSLAAGTPGIEAWVMYGTDKYKIPMGGGCTAVIGPGLTNYLQSGQINGMLMAMRGAAEYERLVERPGDKPGDAMKGMDALSMGHFLIIFLVIVSNIVYFLSRRTSKER